MRALIASLLIILSLPLLYSPIVDAASGAFRICASQAAGTDVCQDVNNQQGKPDPIIEALKVVINVISYAMGIAAVIVIIIAGMRMALGGSDPKTITSSRDQLLYAIVGLLIAVLAQTIVVFVLDKVQ